MEENLESGSDSPSGDFLAKKGAGHICANFLMTLL